MNDCTCLSCRWAVETELSVVCDNPDSQYYQWDVVEEDDTCDRWE